MTAADIGTGFRVIGPRPIQGARPPKFSGSKKVHR